MPDNGGPMSATQRARVVWQQRTPYPLGRRLLALGDGVITSMEVGARAVVRRLDVASGEVLWEHVTKRPLAAPATHTAGVLALPLTGGVMLGLDLETGAPVTPAWRPLLGELTGPVAAHHGQIFARLLPGSGAQLVALRPGQPLPVWTLNDPTRGARDARVAFASPWLLIAGSGPDGRVLAGSVDLGVGKLLWAHDELEGRFNDLWASAGALDVVTDVDGAVGLDPRSGRVRTQRFAEFPFQRAVLAGDLLLLQGTVHDRPALYCFQSVGEKLQGKVTEGLARLIGAGPSEALVERDEGQVGLLSLPKLHPVEIPHGEEIGPVLTAAFARDVAYLLGADRQTITALELDADAAPQRTLGVARTV